VAPDFLEEALEGGIPVYDFFSSSYFLGVNREVG
jgi:hypothetical protein